MVEQGEIERYWHHRRINGLATEWKIVTVELYYISAEVSLDVWLWGRAFLSGWALYLGPNIDQIWIQAHFVSILVCGRILNLVHEFVKIENTSALLSETEPLQSVR